MLFRNIGAVVAVYAVFMAVVCRILPWPKPFTFVFLALPGVLWYLFDATDAAGVVPHRKRLKAVALGFAAVLATSAWFLAVPVILRKV